jgi:hypothetical protein
MFNREQVKLIKSVLTNDDESSDKELIKYFMDELKVTKPVAEAIVGKRKVFQGMIKPLKKFEAIAWIHPKNGGDDYQTKLEIKATNKVHAKKAIEEWIRERSAITTDYKLKEVIKR